MTNKEFALANLSGKVLNRAMRAIEEQPEWNFNDIESILDCFRCSRTKEGYIYWLAIYDNTLNPDQYLPPDYLEAPEYAREGEKGYVECTCANALTYSNCSKKCKRILADEIEPKDKFLEWLVSESTKQVSVDDVLRVKTLVDVLQKYNELKK